MPNLDQCCDLSLELLCQVVLSRVLAIVGEFKLFDCDIIFFVCGFEDISTRTCTNLLFQIDVIYIDSEVVCTLLELHVQYIACLLSLSRLCRVILLRSGSLRSIRLALLALLLRVRPLQLFKLLAHSFIFFLQLLVFLLLLQHVLSRLLLLLLKNCLIVDLLLKL